MISKQFLSMQKQYNLVLINGNRSIQELNADLQGRIDTFLGPIHSTHQ
jgi:hypothetical protein